MCCLFTMTMYLRKQLNERKLYFMSLCQSMVVWFHCCRLMVRLDIMEDMHCRRVVLTSWWQESRESRRGKVQVQFSIFKKNFHSHVTCQPFSSPDTFPRSLNSPLLKIHCSSVSLKASKQLNKQKPKIKTNKHLHLTWI